ncbi:MAG: ATP-dependent sacrificial sulfur transferase LarE [Desulfovibrio sp.]|nr:ATP-dependent sacrificial sulfur transferase LarE [Desulfovibrio sp.]
MVAGLPDSLGAILAGMPRLAIAYSGGLDSRFLAHASQLAGCEILLLHGQGPHIPRAETAYAERWAAARGLRIATFEHDALAIPEVAGNCRMRCYHCKKALFGKIIALARANGFDVVCDGGNRDDLAAYRPGLAAVAELGVKSPLAGLGKAEIRQLARATGLENCGQLSAACLLTRFAYDTAIDRAALAQVDACEQKLRQFLAGAGQGAAELRLRLDPLHAAPVIQIAQAAASLAPELARIAADCGFPGASVLPGPGVSGFFDKSQTQ